MPYVQRRAQLFKKLKENSVAILPSARIAFRSHDSEYPFRQNSHFYYLTGFQEPDSILVLLKGQHEQKTILFNLPNDPQQAIWVGSRLGQKNAIADLKVDEAFDIDHFPDKITDLLSGASTLYYTLGQDHRLDHKILPAISCLRQKNRLNITYPKTVCDLHPLIQEMRLIKSDQEIKIMQQVADISARAHAQLMQACQPGQYEYQLAAMFVHECAMQGCQAQAYLPIVAAGHHACVLHYTDNQSQIDSKDLVLVDAGGELDGYAADITRTFPASGQFSDPQKIIYDIVLSAQLAGIEAVKPGQTWWDVQEAITKTLIKGLKRFNLSEKLERYYVHSSGHWLGLDVHDPSDYKLSGQWRPFEPNMVLTIEPGLYFQTDDTTVDPKWRGIGIRIEDDIWVSEKGPVILSKAAPKSIEAIEEVMSNV